MLFVAVANETERRREAGAIHCEIMHGVKAIGAGDNGILYSVWGWRKHTMYGKGDKKETKGMVR